MQVDGSLSESKPVLSGVPQGTVLGPLLFLIYINDISSQLSPGTTIRLFADDSLLYRTINSIEDTEALQRDLDTLQKWESLWKMEFHPQKCQVLRITNKKNPIVTNYFIHNIQLDDVKAAKYLGVTIDTKLNWKDHYSSLSQKANQVLGFLRRNIPECTSKVKADCYKTLVRPILEYGCTVWDPFKKCDINNIEKIQKRAARFVTGNYTMKTGNTKQNMEKLKWETLEERRAKSKLSMFYKAREKLVCIPLNHLTLNKNRTRNSTEAYVIPRSQIDCHRNSFFPSTVRLWNALPLETKTSISADSFRNNLDKTTVKSAL